MNVTRRQFLKIFAAAGVAVAAPLSALEQVTHRDTGGWPQPEKFEGKSEHYFDLINRELEPGDYIVSYRVQPVLSNGIRRVHEVTVADGGEFRIRIYVEPGYKVGELQLKKEAPVWIEDGYFVAAR